MSLFATGVETEILQIAAKQVTSNEAFNEYITPVGPISAGAAAVTGLNVQGGVLFHDGSPVTSRPAAEVLPSFIEWLPQKTLLIGHNAKSFDSRVLVRNLQKENLLFALRKKVVGFADTLPLCRELVQLENYKQETIHLHLFGCNYPAHDAAADVQALKNIYVKLCVADEKIFKYSLDVQSCIDNVNFLVQKKKYKQTLMQLVEQKVISDGMAEKIASTGLSYDTLLMSANKENGIRKLLTEQINGKCRVTKNERILQSIENHFGKK